MSVVVERQEECAGVAFVDPASVGTWSLGPRRPKAEIEKEEKSILPKRLL